MELQHNTLFMQPVDIWAVCKLKVSLADSLQVASSTYRLQTPNFELLTDSLYFPFDINRGFRFDARDDFVSELFCFGGARATGIYQNNRLPLEEREIAFTISFEAADVIQNPGEGDLNSV